MRRGDIVLVDYPYTRGQAKVRPALVVQNDRDTQRLTNTIVAQITSNLARVQESTQYFIELTAEPHCGLKRDSAVVCVNLLTLDKTDVLRVLGHLSPAAMQRIGDCLKAALELT